MTRPLQPRPQPRPFAHRRALRSGHEISAAPPADVPRQHDEPPPQDGTLRGRHAAQALLAVVALLIAFGLALLLYRQKTAPGRIEALPPAPLVQVMTVAREDRPVHINGNGTVRPAQIVRLIPQVSGRVVWVDPDLAAGAFLPAGRTVIELDPTDFQLGLERAEAALAGFEASQQRLATLRQIAEAELAEARTRLEVELAERQIAVQEYRRMYPRVDEEEIPDLAARRPQLRQAEASVSAARARLEDVAMQAEELAAQRRQAVAQVQQTRVQLGRTILRVPQAEGAEDALYRVLEADVEVGQLAGPEAPVASVYRHDALEVPVPLQADALLWLGEMAEGEPAKIFSTAVESRAPREWPARVARVAGQLDPQSRLVNVTVSVEDAGEPDRPQTLLVPGMFVEAQIEGRMASGVVALPAEALRPQQVVWVVEDGRLSARQVQVIRRHRGQLLVRGLRDGDRVVVSPLEYAAEGMAVRIAGETALAERTD